MILGVQELLQIDQAFLHRLFETNPKALLELSIKLAVDLKEARERLDQNPSNSSTPSGNQAPWDKGEKNDESPLEDERVPPDNNVTDDTLTDNVSAQQSADQADENQAAPTDDESLKRNPGKQPGAPGFGRSQKLPITHVEEHRCNQCSACNANPEDREKPYTGFYTLDVKFGDTNTPGILLTNTHHIYYSAVCPDCGLENRSEPRRATDDKNDWKNVGLTEWRLIGPSLAALIVYLSNSMRISKRLIRLYFHEVFGLDLSIGSIQKSLIESARALAPVEAQIVQSLIEGIDPSFDEHSANDVENRPDKKTVLYADETSHPQSGDLYWLWIFMTATTALYKVGKRSRLIFDELVDLSGFSSWLMSDGYGVYRNYPYRLRCWAHLIRKAKGLSESYTASVSKDGQQMLTLIEQLMKAIYQAREGTDEGRQSIKPQHKETLEKIRLLCTAMSDAPHKKTRELGREFLNDWDAIFRVLEYPVWPLTNNTAERGLRHWVILRRITQGTRSRQGSQALAIFASVITTCRLRNSSPLLYIRDVIVLRRQGKDVPDLPPVPVKI
jgi:hypothetical protein